MIRRIVTFTAPRQVELREEALPALGADDLLVEVICSAVSAGTEMLVYQGRFPQELETDSAIASLRGSFRYPLAYGYACVGKVVEVGNAVDDGWLDQCVFAFQPHTSHFISKPEALFPIPASLSPENACFLPNMETAVNLVQEGAPILGERVLVLGQGAVGLLTTSLLSEFPLEKLVTVDRYALRRETSLKMGVDESFDPENIFQTKEMSNPVYNGKSVYTQSFDLTYELSGSPSALNDALALTRFSGRIVIGSWYGEKQAPISLGGSFHRSRIKLISSQVSSIAPELSSRWDKARRFNVAWKALERIKPERWISHRFSVEESSLAYQLLDQHPQDVLQVAFTYGK